MQRVDADGIVDRLVTFYEVFLIRIKFIGACIWLWFFGVAVIFNVVIVSIAEILHPCQQSWCSDYSSVTGIFKSTIPDFYSFISTNKMYKLSSALSHYCHLRFCALHDFVQSNKVKNEKILVFLYMSYSLAFLHQHHIIGDIYITDLAFSQLLEWDKVWVAFRYICYPF